MKKISIICMIITIIKDAIEVYKNFSKMLNEESYDEEVLEQAIVYDDIYKQYLFPLFPTFS